MSKEAMKLALEALEKLMRFESDSWELGSCRVAGQAIKALREALAEQPAQLPFGVGGGLVAIKTLLSRDPCVHANTAIQMIDAILAEQPAQQSQAIDVAFLRQVLGVAIAGLFEHHKDDVLRVFTPGELQAVVDLTEPLHPQQVEDIYKRAWVMLTTPQAQPAQQQEPVAYFVNCTSCGEEKKVDRGNHHPWCFCGSDSFDWGNSRIADTTPQAQPAPVQQEPVAMDEVSEDPYADGWTDAMRAMRAAAPPAPQPAQQQEYWEEQPDGSVIPVDPSEMQPAREWVGLTNEEREAVIDNSLTPACVVLATEAKLKEKNT